jgi:hypothetical protein
LLLFLFGIFLIIIVYSPRMQQYVIIGGRWHTVYQKKKTTVPNLIYVLKKIKCQLAKGVDEFYLLLPSLQELSYKGCCVSGRRSPRRILRR